MEERENVVNSCNSLNRNSKPTLYLDLDEFSDNPLAESIVINRNSLEDFKENLECRETKIYSNHIRNEKIFSEESEKSDKDKGSLILMDSESLVLEPTIKIPQFGSGESIEFSAFKSLAIVDDDVITSSPRRESDLSPSKKKKKNSGGSLKNDLLKFSMTPLRGRKSTFGMKPSDIITRKLKLYSVISTVFIVKKFIMKLKSCVSFRKTHGMTERHFDYIKDSSFSFEVHQNQMKKDLNKNRRSSIFSISQGIKNSSNTEFKLTITNWIKSKKKLWSECFEKYIFSEKFIPLLDPSSKFRFCWDILHLIFIMAFLIKIPIEISFEINFKITNSPISEFLLYCLLPLIFFFLDFLINLNIPFYRNGKIINKRQKIIFYYFKKDFKFDLLSFFAIILNIFFFERIENIYKYFSLFFFFRLRNVKLIVSRIEEYLFLDDNHYNTFALIRLVLRILLLTHIFACIWYLVGVKSSSNVNWLIDANIQDDPWHTKYIYSYYFIAITMSTVGFGDIIPKNTIETAFNIIFVYFACGIFAYTLNSVAIILQDLNKKEIGFNNQVMLINGYMRQKLIPKNLRHRVRKYLEYLWAEERSYDNPEIQYIINNLSESLRSELILEANGHFLKNINILSDNFSEEILRKAVFLMKEINLMPGDIIFNEADHQNFLIYYIKKGEVEFFNPSLKDSEQNFRTLGIKKNGMSFGEDSFITDQPRTISARSTDFTTLITISKIDFLELLNQYPEDYEIFCTMKAKIVIDDDSTVLQTFCSACNKHGHLIQNCYFVTMRIPKTICLAKHNYSKSHERLTGHIRRSRKSSYKCLKNISKMKESAIKIKNVLESEITLKMFSDFEFESLSENSSSDSNFESNSNPNSLSNSSNRAPQRMSPHNTEPVIFTSPQTNSVLSPTNQVNNQQRTSLPRSPNNISFPVSMGMNNFSTADVLGSQRRSLFNQDSTNLITFGGRRASLSVYLENQGNQVRANIAEPKIKEQSNCSANSNNVSRKKKQSGYENSMSIKDQDLIDEVKIYYYFYPHYNINNVIRYYELNNNRRRKKYMNSKEYKRSILDAVQRTRAIKNPSSFFKRDQFVGGLKRFFEKNEGSPNSDFKSVQSNDKKSSFFTKLNEIIVKVGRRFSKVEKL